MSCTSRPGPVIFVALLASLLGLAPAMAKSSNTGKLHVVVSPKQAYVFVDGKAIGDGNQTMALPAGEHEVGVRNYGYLANAQQAQIVAGKTLTLKVSLQKSGTEVSGPFGDIELKGHPRAAVLLNGTTPAYFVGHVDEFDNNWLWHQWLLVKPGNYQVMVTRKGQTIWSGPVAVKAGQRVVVYLNHNGEMKTKDFKRGLTLGPQTRFDAGIASASVDVAPVTAQLSASQAQTGCGQPSMLSWKTSDAADASITPLGAVAASGEKTVMPTQNTTYTLVAKGPGGDVTRTAAVDVNGQPTAMLMLSSPDVAYHKIGDRVVERGQTTLSWSASDGSKVSIEPMGAVSATGSRNITAMPDQTTTGPVHQDITYTLHATNACGGTATRTATLHLSGSIDPAPAVTLASVFYPTNYPQRSHPQIGLLPSQKKDLDQAAATFKNHEVYSQPNQLLVVGHADTRGSAKYNLALSQSRAKLVKDYLVSQGIPASEIQVRAEGKGQELTDQQVQKLQGQDPQQAPAWMSKNEKATWLAYNRRVDIIRQPAGQQSTEAFPNDASAARILWERPQPPLKAVEAAAGQRSGNRQSSSLYNN